MTFQSYLMFITTQPLLLRLSMVTILIAVIFAVGAFAARLHYRGQERRPQRARNVVQEQPRKVIYVPNFY